MDDVVASARGSDVARRIREARLIVVLRRLAPRPRLLRLLDELADAGTCIFEITLDADGAVDDLAACRDHLAGRPDGPFLVGAGTVRSQPQLEAAVAADAAFGVSPLLDLPILAAALAARLPFMPGAYTPTEVDAAWRAGGTFVKLFPGSSLGPSHVRELRGPLPEVEIVVTGGVDASNARAFLEAGAVAVGIGSAIVRASADERRSLVGLVSSAGRP